jgi:hypothetical protein
METTEIYIKYNKNIGERCAVCSRERKLRESSEVEHLKGENSALSSGQRNKAECSSHGFGDKDDASG